MSVPERRGDSPGLNLVTMLVMALDRLTGREDWTETAADGG